MNDKNLTCFKCWNDTATLTYEENRIYKVSCLCGRSYEFEHSSWKTANEYHQKMLELYAEIDKGKILAIENTQLKNEIQELRFMVENGLGYEDMENKTIDQKLADETLECIERYRSKKNNDIFDDFYHSHLDFMIKCIKFYQASTSAFEGQEREPCDYCNDEYGRYHKKNGYSLIKHRYCAVCGHKLEG